jgi:hypothetical protein
MPASAAFWIDDDRTNAANDNPARLAAIEIADFCAIVNDIVCL